MKTNKLTAILTASILAFGLLTTEVEAKSKLTIPLDDSFHPIDYTFRSGGGVFTQVKVIEQDDKLYLCGVAHITGIQRVFGQQLMTSVFLTLNDVEILNNIRFFKTVHKTKIKPGMQASCKVTKAKAPFPKERNYFFDTKQKKFWD